MNYYFLVSLINYTLIMTVTNIPQKKYNTE